MRWWLMCCAGLAVSVLAADDGALKVVRVGAVAADVVEVEVRIGAVAYGHAEPYTARPGDRIEEPEHNRWVMRDGRSIGSLVGSDGKLLFTHDRCAGEPLPPAWLTPEGYRLSSADDPAYAGGRAPVQVFRKSKPTDLARVGPWEFRAPVHHHFFLPLAAPLQPGKSYSLELPGQAPVPFTFDVRRLRSSAVHVTQIGFRPDDPAKVAFVSCWRGSGGPQVYQAGTAFELLDDATGEPVFSGKSALAKAHADATEDAYRQNHNGTDVFLLDFSAFDRPGKYRLGVSGMGCSNPFVIGPDVWRDAFVTSVRGLYHQRSGIALGPLCTTFNRPRCFHPDDGVKVFASTAGLMDTGNGLNRNDSNFGELNKGRTTEIVPNAWGGYQDAGDWDRRIAHLVCSRLLFDLVALAPDFAGQLGLNLPESGNNLPDTVDEALWGLDIYRRMQLPDGGVRGGIESAEHPRQGEASWQESLPVMAYAPDVWSSYLYAATAGQAAEWLAGAHAELAAPWRESAERAMRWAEQHLAERTGRNDPPDVNDARNLAAAVLYRLTGAAEWHQLFLATTVFKEPGKPLREWQHHDSAEAAWVYVRTERPEVDKTVQSRCRQALQQEADERVQRCEQTGFRWTGNPWAPVAWGALTIPDAISLIHAHVLTGEPKYLRAAVLACQFGAGANPDNLCYSTGVGLTGPQHPLHVDSRISGQTPPAGLTVLGPCDPLRDRGGWAQKNVAPFVYPEITTWPAVEGFWDVFWYPMINEYTVQQNIGPNAFVWGYLAGRR
ncbi:MAG: glycoside hydrolase family 9 protein [Armatimonadetes bacterium]|nr:glycoside hydrolase family 9 protein [Armatimonadota bacterium]